MSLKWLRLIMLVFFAQPGVAQEVLAPAQLPKGPAIELPPSGARPDGAPALGMGLSGIADWSTQHPFIDLFKSSRPWVGLQSAAPPMSIQELEAGGYLTPEGWPRAVPEGVTAFETRILTSQPVEARALRGNYVLRYSGNGKIALDGRAKRVRHTPGEISFFYEPGGDDGHVAIRIVETDPNNPIRDIAVVQRDLIQEYEAGALFNPAFVAVIEDMRVLRFADWMMTNAAPPFSWPERPRMSDASWAQRGVPLEVMLQLANQVGADPWFALPHNADDGYIRRFAQFVRGGLDPRLKAHVEYSNEAWIPAFPQTAWMAGQAEALWGKSETGAVQFYAMRAAQVMEIWNSIFKEEETRLIRIISVPNGQSGIEEYILTAPLGFLKTGLVPADHFDAYAVSAYFGHELGSDAMAEEVRKWLVMSRATALTAGEQQGLSRIALREYVTSTEFDAASRMAGKAIAEGSLRQLIEEDLPYHAGAARKYGLDLMVYEGGAYVTGLGAQMHDPQLSAFLSAFNYTPDMAVLYRDLLQGWEQAGGRLFTAFADVAPASKWGNWGAKRTLEDENPRWHMLMAFNASAPADWETRDAAAFANGVTRYANPSGERLQGTKEEDILIGGTGKDVLVSNGGDDILSGGPGRDRAILPGSRGDYRRIKRNDRLLLDGPEGRVTLTGIEEVTFESAPDRAHLLSDL